MLELRAETEALVQKRAAVTGKTPDQVISEALGVSDSPQSPQPKRKKASLEDLMAIAARCSARPRLDNRTPEEIIGYDERGLPA
jgi:antitoxin VapB